MFLLYSFYSKVAQVKHDTEKYPHSAGKLSCCCCDTRNDSLVLIAKFKPVLYLFVYSSGGAASWSQMGRSFSQSMCLALSSLTLAAVGVLVNNVTRPSVFLFSESWGYRQHTWQTLVTGVRWIIRLCELFSHSHVTTAHWVNNWFGADKREELLTRVFVILQIQYSDYCKLTWRICNQ